MSERYASHYETAVQVERELFKAVVQYVDQTLAPLTFQDSTIRDMMCHKLRCAVLSGVSMAATSLQLSGGKVSPQDMLTMIDNMATQLNLKKVPPAPQQEVRP